MATEFPEAWIVCIEGPEPSDLGQGWQWFSILGVSEENRPARVAAGMPHFLASVHHWQAISRLGAAATSLIGFSQGGIMALESTRGQRALAARVVSIAGRFARAPELPAHAVTLHLLHGESDALIPSSQTSSAAATLAGLGADVTADILPAIGHDIPAAMAERLVARLRNHVPRQPWEAAHAALPP